jgi:uncharacterized membrane protein
MHFFKLFLVTLVACFFLDMLWLGLIAKNLYSEALGPLMRKSNGLFAPNWPAAILVYLAIATGIICFSLPKADHSYLLGMGWGAVFGMVIYGVYEFTNYSILANWPLKITIIDLAWGMLLCGLTTCFAVFMENWMSS